ncbi:MAG: hypothetical protein ACR2P2_19250 [Nakamurella sp.]
MTTSTEGLERRMFLRGALATAAMVPLGGFLASCASSGTTTLSTSSTSAAATGSGATSGGATRSGSGDAMDKSNPFGVAKGSKVDAVIFNGGYGVAYAEFAGKAVEKEQAGTTVKVSLTTHHLAGAAAALRRWQPARRDRRQRCRLDRPGPVEQRRGRHLVSVGIVERERDEVPDQGGFPDDRGSGAVGDRQLVVSVYVAVQHRCEAYIVPLKSANAPGRQEFLRAMLSHDAVNTSASERSAASSSRRRARTARRP